MSLSATPMDLALAMSFAALPARSPWAAEAVGLSDSTPTDRNAMSGLVETIASPLANTPGVKEDEEGSTAAGDATTTCGRLAATTASATANAQTAAIAPDNTTGRTVGDISFKSMRRKRPPARAGNTPRLTRLTRERARQIAVMGQMLDARRPKSILRVVQQLGYLQLDPTAAVARTEHLVLWSRLGNTYRPADLARLTYVKRSLFEHRAFIYPATDYPVLRAAMGEYLAGEDGWRRRIREWVEVNNVFHTYVLAELEARGPLRSRQLDDRAVVAAWPSSGWNDGRNVGQMLEFMSARGEIAISAREGNDRLWDLAQRVHRIDQPVLTAEAAARVRAERRLSALGIARPEATLRSFGTWASVGGVGVPVEVEGVKGTWVVDPKLLRRRFEGRTAILSPFDRLVHDRRRLLDLFGFDYVLEMYFPPAKRPVGYYVLPILHGARFVGRAAVKADRDKSVLRVPALHMEPKTGSAEVAAAKGELNELAAWLALDKVVVEKLIKQ